MSVPSFDCEKARLPAELSICSDLALGWRDRRISELYQAILRHGSEDERTSMRRGQRDWLGRRNQCRDMFCVAQALSSREAFLKFELQKMNKELRINIRNIGACAESRIDYLGPRLVEIEGEEPSGTSVEFSNGIRQVSYAREPNVLASHLGDRVKICLVSLPRNCPAGDNRGKVYSVENLRTHLRWDLSDSSHSCGGA